MEGANCSTPQIGSTPNLSRCAVDVIDYLAARSSSAAKKAEAAFKISFARRSSRFSLSSSAIRRCASVAPLAGAVVDLGLFTQ